MRTVSAKRVLTKHCDGCGLDKPRDDEHFYRAGRRGFQALCKPCFTATYQGKHVERIRAMKDGQRCLDCGLPFPFYVLDYDHRPGEVKRFEIGKAVKGSYKLETILAEIAKCDLICANCHRVRTWLRATGSEA